MANKQGQMKKRENESCLQKRKIQLLKKKPVQPPVVQTILANFNDQEGIDRMIGEFRKAGERENKLADEAEAYFAATRQYRTQIKSFPIVDAQKIFDSDNIHDTYALIEDEVEKWIFKSENSHRNNTQMCTSEHMASLVNFDGALNVPLTVKIDIGDVSGSAQLVVPNCIKMATLGKNQELNKIDLLDLQKTVVFDLLFGNMDRNDGNVIV